MELRPKQPFEYPKYNSIPFEEFFYNFYVNNNITTKMEYLPIFWTSFYLKRDWGNGDMSDLQEYLNSLDKNKKYFTLLQFDDGFKNDVSDLNLYVFSLAQDKKYDFILPTTCRPRPNINKDRNRDIFCSFFGRYKGEWNHPLHDEILNILPKGRYNTGKSIDYETYCDFLERSKFFICANGRSPTTFKICECLQSGTIPVFLYDKKWIPFENVIDFEKACVFIGENDIHNIDNILSNIDDNKILEMKKYGEYIYENYYEYNALSKKIIEVINNL
jgi:hypothetical protein